MNLSHRSLLLFLATTGVVVQAFTPASYGASPNQVGQFVQEKSRFLIAPMGMTDEDEEDDDILNGVAAALEEKDKEPAPEDYIVTAGELESDQDDDDVGLEDDGEPPSWYTSQLRMEELRNAYKRHEKDTGSPEYQVAGMTERIAYLTKHLQQQPKDFSTRRGLVALVNKRRRLLNYLADVNVDRYVEIIKSLGIRHRAPGRVPTRAEKYSRFPGQKKPKKHLIKKKK